MPRLALTEKTFAKLPAKTGRQTLYWDDGPRAVRGFGVLCSGTTHNKAFVVQRDLPGGRTRRVTIGGVNELSVEEARKRAAYLVLDMRRGVDPKARVIAPRCARPCTRIAGRAAMRCAGARSSTTARSSGTWATG